MKKNIIIGFLALFTAFLLFYTYYQKKQADRTTILLHENQKTIEKLERQAIVEMDQTKEQLALVHAQLAQTIQQLQIAEEELKKTKKSK